MAVGAASVEALCASADTVSGSRSDGSAPARPFLRNDADAADPDCLDPELKRWSVVSTWGVAGDLPWIPLSPLFRGERVRVRGSRLLRRSWPPLTPTLSP